MNNNMEVQIGRIFQPAGHPADQTPVGEIGIEPDDNVSDARSIAARLCLPRARQYVELNSPNASADDLPIRPQCDTEPDLFSM